MESLKIAFYTDTFLPAHDGVVSSILNFRSELIRRGHEVYVFAPGDSRTKESLKGLKNVYIVRGMKFKKYPQYNLAFMPFATEMKLNRIDPDIIHAHTPFFMGTWALAMAKINKIPIVGTYHTMFADRFVLKEYASSMISPKLLEKYSWAYARFFYNKCNAVTAPSETIKRLLEKRHIKNLSVVPNGIDMERFNPNINGGTIRKSIAESKQEKVIMYVGRISREKRIETLLKAAKMLGSERYNFVFVGTGPASGYYQKMANRLKLRNVRFTGFVDDRILPKYYAAADLFCLPSTFETQGIVTLEAMATGAPVVGADSLALKEIIKNGKNGERFTPNDPASCARKIRKVLEDTSRYRDMVGTAREYSVPKTTDMLMDVYSRVIKSATI